MRKGLSLVETIVGVALMLVIFLGLLGFLKMAVRVVGSSRLKVGAVALANEQMEKIKNLPYEEVGTMGGIPPGEILQTEDIFLNNVNYTRRVLVQYVDDPADGEGVDDENGVNADYKRVRVEVSWQGRDSVEPVILVSNIVPKGIEMIGGGGTLKINVFDATILPVVSAKVHVENEDLDPPVSLDVFTNTQGKVVFPGAPAAGSYKITVSKTGYSSIQTYDVTAENVDPQPSHLTILEGETSESTFYIDVLASKRVSAYEAEGQDSFDDSFVDSDDITATSSVAVFGGEVVLAGEEPNYAESGYIISSTISSPYLKEWQAFSWSDIESASTTVGYQVLFASTTGWELIPEEDLVGNSAGFSEAPVSLSGLSVSKYPEIRLRANLSTIDAGFTPFLLDWHLTWLTEHMPLPFVGFDMRGEKIIGYGPGGSSDPIYKYLEEKETGSDGSVLIENLEWDNYWITTNGAETGFDISEICPFQPASIVPAGYSITNLVLTPHFSNTLLTSVQEESGAFISGVGVRLFRIGYDETKVTSTSCGQAFFSSLSSAAYNIEISHAGFEIFNLSNFEIAGQETLKIILTRL